MEIWQERIVAESRSEHDGRITIVRDGERFIPGTSIVFPFRDTLIFGVIDLEPEGANS